MALLSKTAFAGICIVAVCVAITSLNAQSATDDETSVAGTTAKRQKSALPTQVSQQSTPPKAEYPSLVELSRKAEKRIQLALQKKIDLSFSKTELGELIDFLAEEAGIPIWVDKEALEDVGLSLKITLTDELEGVTIEQALDWTLSPIELTWLIEDETLKVTTDTQAEETMFTRTYNVRVLIESSRRIANQHSAVTPSSTAPDSSISQQIDQRDSDVKTATGPITGGTKPGGREPGLITELLQIGGLAGGGIQSTISAEEWLTELLITETSGPWMDIDGTGGTISSLRDTITVTQTWRMQREIEQLIDALNRVAGGQTKRGSIVARPVNYPMEADGRLQASLQKKTSVDYLKMPLSSVVADIAKQHNIRIRINAKALAEEGVERNEPISLSLSEVALGSALRILLQPLSLTYHVAEGTLWITTEIDAEEALYTTVYEVSDLVEPDDDYESLIELTQQETTGPWADIDGTGGTMSAAEAVGAMVVRQTYKVHREIGQRFADLRKTIAAQPKPEPAPQPDPNQLITRVYDLSQMNAAADLLTAIPRFVTPDAWSEDNQDVAIQKVGDSLVVRQTRSMHDKIERFLQRFGFFTRSGFGTSNN